MTGLFLKSSSTYSATRGAAIRSGSEPPMSRHASLQMGQSTMAEAAQEQTSRAGYWSFHPPSTLQSISQLHETFPRFLLRCPQPQNTHLMFTGFQMGLSNLQGLSLEGGKKTSMRTLFLNPNSNTIHKAEKHFCFYHVECLQSPKCSHQAAVFIVLVRRADQQRPLHSSFQSPESKKTPKKHDLNRKCGDLKDALENNLKNACRGRPFDAVDCCVTKAPDIVIVPVYRASGGKDQAVSRETRDLQDHHILSQPAVHLARDRNKHTRRSGLCLCNSETEPRRRRLTEL